MRDLGRRHCKVWRQRRLAGSVLQDLAEDFRGLGLGSRVFIYGGSLSCSLENTGYVSCWACQHIKVPLWIWLSNVTFGPQFVGLSEHCPLP